MPVANFILAQHGHSLQAGDALAPAAEGAALIMSVIVGGILVALALGSFLLIRRAKRGESPEQTLLRELREDLRRDLEGRSKLPPEPTPEGDRQSKNWEKDPDWWKNEPKSNPKSPE